MNLTDARMAVAEALNGIEGLRVTARPVKGNLRPNDGWVTVNTVSPGEYLGGAVLAVLNAYVSLGADEKKADEQVDELSAQILYAIINSNDIFAYDLSIQPQAIIAGEGVPGQVFALALTLTVELSS